MSLKLMHVGITLNTKLGKIACGVKCVNVMKPAQEKIENIDQRLRIQPLRGGNLLYIT